MKNQFNVMRLLLCVVCSAWTLSLFAVPAYRGWQTKVQPDGTQIKVRLVGDEFYHYWETEQGTLAIEQPDGRFVKTADPVPTREEQSARRAASRASKAAPVGPKKQKAVGTTPNLAPRGVVILVNFTNPKMNSSHTKSVFDNLCNAVNCTANGGYPSAAQYFADQSNETYRPVFDVIGPVNLTHPTAYYGEQGYSSITGGTESDLYLADFVIDAVLAADAAGCDFSQYDSDGDGMVDFVYFIYAGLGQAYGGSTETIWPHNWNLFAALYLGYTHGNSGYYANDYDYNLPELDGKLINNYACSAELDGYSNLGGIGTLCHEFGHVMGLPDLYDTSYGTNYNNNLTPNEWDIMDGGSYNGNMHCPPNYDPWEKYFFGWVNPVNYGTQGANLTLNANGLANYNVVQVNTSGTKKNWNATGWNYYLENRQQTGWDSYVPAHGMVIWKVNYDEEIWGSNAPNHSDTYNSPRFTIVCSSGSEVGSSNGTGNVFGGSNTSKTSWTGVSGKPVKNIKETNGKITAIYIEEPPVEPVDSITLYCVNAADWSNMMAYVWGNDGVTITNYKDWPGETAKKTASKVHGKTVYSYTFPSSFNYIIFNDGAGTQTADQAWPTGKPIFMPEGMDAYGWYYGTWYASLSEIPEPVIPYVVTWVVDGEVLEKAEYSNKGTDALRLPSTPVMPCSGTRFIGWTKQWNWANPFATPSDLFTQPSGKVTGNVTYYALFE